MANEHYDPWKDYLLYFLRVSHQFSTLRIRQKLSFGTDQMTLFAEAMEMVRREMGFFPSEVPYDPDADPDEVEALDRQMHEMTDRNLEQLTEVESYMWGLGVAGLVHQWERGVREAVAAFQQVPPKTETLEKMDFGKLCSEIEKIGFKITSHPAYPEFRIATLIANTIKHGSGKAFRDLIAMRADLFRGEFFGKQVSLPLRPENLRVSEIEFDSAAAAIDTLWSAFEDAHIAMLRAAKS